MAQIEKRGDLQWRARIKKKGFPEQSKTFFTKKDAEDWAKVIESEMIRGTFIARTDSEKVTFGDLVDRYLREVTPSKKNWKSETEIMSKIKEKFGQHALVAIQSKEIAEYRDELLQKKRAASTVCHYLNAISVVIDTALKEWGYVLPANPVRNVRRPSQPSGRDRRLSHEEEKALLEECKKSSNVWLEPVVIVATETALRQGEIFKLTWEHVNLKKRIAHIPETKNGEARTIPLSTRAAAVLDALPRSIDGKVIQARQEALRKCFERAAARAGIKNLRFHDLRHEATSRLFEKGLNPMEAASVTGHKTLAMLKRYTHLRAEDLAKKLG